MAVQEVTLNQFAGWIGGLNGNLAKLDFTQPLRVCAIAAQAETKDNFSASRTPDGAPWHPLKFNRPRGGNKPLRDTGLLMASVTSQSAQGQITRINEKSLVFGTNLEQATLHQYGGTVTPKNAKALTIPLTKEAARAGRASRFPGELFVWTNPKSKKAFLAENKKKKLILHYLLAKSAIIPARPFLGISRKLAEQWDSILGEFVRKKLGDGPINSISGL